MLHYIKPYRHYAVLTIVFMVSEVLIDLYQPRLMEAIVNEGYAGPASRRCAGPLAQMQHGP